MLAICRAIRGGTSPLIGVTGSTGQLGGRVAIRLAAHGQDQRLIVRNLARAPQLPGAEVVQAAYEDTPSMRAVLRGVHTLFLVSGWGAKRVEQHYSAIDAAVAAGVVTEQTNATTTQCWCPVAKAWVTDLLDQLSIPTSMLPPVVEAGTVLGQVLPELRGDLGGARVVAPATHDTGSAIVATPVSLTDGWGYISSGTWSLVGLELQNPVMTPEVLAANCTNEGGVFGTTRFLKNVMGLWLLQECQRHWARESRASDYNTLLADVDGVPAFATLIDPDDPRFLAPEDMLAAINSYLQEHGQTLLSAPAAFARCIMESLVLRYREVFQQINGLTGVVINEVHVLGGGARNARLNQWLADALDLPVIAGPYEATALGNALMQLVGLGELRNLEEVRTVAQGAPTQVFAPRTSQLAAWNEAAQSFSAMVGDQ